MSVYSYLAMDSIFVHGMLISGIEKGCDGVGGREGAATSADWVEFVGDTVVCESVCGAGIGAV